jgi:hypothetical protein
MSEVDPLDRKAYIRGWEPKQPPEDREISYWFCESPKDAAAVSALQTANDYVSILNIGVRIDSIQGGQHVLRNFTVEPYEGKFLMTCSGPFIPTASGSGQDVEQ